MKAIMLVAGESTRMYPLTYNKPKPLLKIINKTILQHNLEQLKANNVDEITLVVGHEADQIKNSFGTNFNGIKLNYVFQNERLGTGHALLQAKDFVKDTSFIVIYGDDVYHKDDIKLCFNYYVCVTAKEVPDPERFGVFLLENNAVRGLIEKPKDSISNLANTGLYVFNKDIFSVIEDLPKSERGEIELTDAVKKLISGQPVPYEILKKWMPVGYPWDLLTANETMIKEIEKEKNLIDKTSVVEKNATLEGPVKVGKNTRIKNGAYIEGPVVIGDDCTIGPNCYIRVGTVIGNECKIGNAVEIKNSIIGDNTNIGHLSYIGDSVIGNNCNLGAGTITANLRHDKKTVKAMVKGQLVDTGRKKFGAVLADYTKTGIHTSIYPGVMIGPFSWTTPGSIVKENIEPFNLFDGTQKPLDKSKFVDLVKKEDLKTMEKLFEKLVKC
jgi:bifunctional UDP-N-acetylglucosamine pyrophosphorylase/glucosamine-1-phosphate N-acetyltransferase